MITTEPTLLASPKLLDKIVQEIRVSLSSLSWVQYDFPLVKVGVDNDSSTYPQVYIGGNNSIDIRPDNKWKSYFFFEGDQVDVVDEQKNCKTQLSVIFWGMLNLVDSTKNYDYTSELIDDVLTKLINKNCYNINYTTEHEEIFNKYNALKQELTQLLMKPSFAFKINFDVDFQSC